MILTSFSAVPSSFVIFGMNSGNAPTYSVDTDCERSFRILVVSRS